MTRVPEESGLLTASHAEGTGQDEPRRIPVPGRRTSGVADLLELPAPMMETCRSALLQLEGDRVSSLGVISAVRGEGRTSVATGFALVLSRDYGRRTLLVELDFTNPVLAARLGLDPAVGLADVIDGRATLDEVVQPLGEDLSVITAGQPDQHSTHALSARLLKSDLVRQMATRYGVVVADLPPALESTVGPSLARATDRLVLVVRAATTPMRQVQEAIVTLPAEPAVLLNGTQSDLPRWLDRWSDA
jgi:Mrp family chromosome partitioning ATPase